MVIGREVGNEPKLTPQNTLFAFKYINKISSPQFSKY